MTGNPLPELRRRSLWPQRSSWSWILLASALASAWIIAAGCGPSSAPPAPSLPRRVTGERDGQVAESRPLQTAIAFTEIAVKVGIDFVYRNDEESGAASLVEAIGGGVALLDYDGDGTLDLFFPGGGRHAGPQQLAGRPSALFRQVAAGAFCTVAEGAGIASSRFYSHGAAAGDWNNDGFSDLLVTGYGGVSLFLNLGDGTFLEAAGGAGLTDIAWGTSAAWGDVDQDGWLDLVIVQYVDWSFENDPACTGKAGQRDWCSPQRFQPLPTRLFLNQRDGTFRDATEEHRLQRGKSLGVILADLDLDRDLDLYVANDTGPNFLYRNDGPRRWTEVGLASGTSLDPAGSPDGSMGVDVGDYNADGRPDIWVANFEQEWFAMYENLGNGLFLHQSQALGLGGEVGRSVGWGTALADFDGDLDLDLIVTTGHAFMDPLGAPRRQPPLVLENQAGRRFRNVAGVAGSYTAAVHDGRGLAVGDLDNDGRLDVIVSHLNQPVAVLHNESAPTPRWLGWKLVGRTTSRDAIGAVMTLRTTGGTWTRQITGGGSYLSSSDRRLLWRIPPGVQVESVVIDWPSGRRQMLTAEEREREGYRVVIEPR